MPGTLVKAREELDALKGDLERMLQAPPEPKHKLTAKEQVEKWHSLAGPKADYATGRPGVKNLYTVYFNIGGGDAKIEALNDTEAYKMAEKIITVDFPNAFIICHVTQ